VKNSTHSIKTGEHENPGLRFADLFEEGIKLAQQFSGDHWTDFNYHDPGVTMLEYMIYALMDLSYRSNLPIEDLFLMGTDDFNNERENLLYAPHDVFPTDPYTSEDYRKMIIDRVKLVKNAWVNPVHLDPAGHKGLFEILIQAQDDVNDLEADHLEQEIQKLFHQYRNLGHDLSVLKLLTNIPLSLVGEIYLETDAVAEYVMAKIFTELDHYINPEIRMENPFELISSGHAPESVFSGPKPVHGVILAEHLKPKTDAVYVSQIQNIIANIEGVKGVGQIQVLRKGLPVNENLISFDADTFPSIEFQNLQNGYPHQLKLIKNNIEQDIDEVTTQQLIDFDLAERRTHYRRRLDYTHALPKGKFTKNQLNVHYAIHNEFPENYAIGKLSQPQNASADRQAQAKQLKAYLAIFEQVIANHLSQLTHMREMMSVSSSVDRTYFTQLPSDIHNIQEILTEKIPDYEKFLNEISNDPAGYAERRNRILDHLLARFGEQLDTEVIRKYKTSYSKESEYDISKEIIQTKVTFLQNIIALSRSRNVAFNYLSENTWNSDNISNLEWKLFIALNFRHHTKRSLVNPLLETLQMRRTVSGAANEWKEMTIDISELGKVKVLKLSKDQYQSEEIRFPDMEIHFVARLFSQGINPKYLRVVSIKEKGSNSHAILFRGLDSIPDLIIFQHEDQTICERVMDRFVSSIREISLECEGFHLIEHILLRPLEPRLFVFSIMDAKGKVLMSGYQPGNFEQQSLLAEELPVIGSKTENYSVTSESDSNLFQVVLYDASYQPVAKLKKSFHSRVGAENELKRAAAYLQSILDRKILLEQVLEINSTNGEAIEVPNHFEFSHSLSFILPNWPTRFSNDEFIQRFKGLLRENIPAHFTAHVYLLDPETMYRFEELYTNWLKAKASKDKSLSLADQLSTRIIQLLVECKTNGLLK
jgi:hypothetical protein